MKRSNVAVLNRFRTVSVSEICVSAITLSELAFGVQLSPRKLHDQSALEAYLEYVAVLDFPGVTAAEYAEIRADFKARGCLIGSNDLFIAAHARFLDLTLVTNNTREFERVKGLKLENWTK